MANAILENKKFTDAEIFGGTAILVESQPHMEYVNNQRTGRQLGLKYVVVAPERGFDKVTVKVAEIEPPMKNEDIQARNAAKNYVYVRFDGFEARLWQNWRDDNNLAIDAKANKIMVLPDAAKPESPKGGTQ